MDLAQLPRDEHLKTSSELSTLQFVCRGKGSCLISVLVGVRLGSCLNKSRSEIPVSAGEQAALSTRQRSRDIFTAHDKWVKMGPGVLKISC